MMTKFEKAVIDAAIAWSCGPIDAYGADPSHLHRACGELLRERAGVIGTIEYWHALRPTDTRGNIFLVFVRDPGDAEENQKICASLNHQRARPGVYFRDNGSTIPVELFRDGELERLVHNRRHPDLLEVHISPSMRIGAW